MHGNGSIPGMYCSINKRARVTDLQRVKQLFGSQLPEAVTAVLDVIPWPSIKSNERVPGASRHPLFASAAPRSIPPRVPSINAGFHADDT